MRKLYNGDKLTIWPSIYEGGLKISYDGGISEGDDIFDQWDLGVSLWCNG